MAVAIGAGGVIGVAIEVTANTYVAPTKYIPVNSESLKYTPNMIERRPIRATAGLVGLIVGDGMVEGDLEFDVSADLLVFFMYAARTTIVKSGAGPYVYTITPNSNAVPTKTLSITVKRNAENFGYVGCAVSSLTITIGDDGKMTASVSIIGSAEAGAAVMTPAWPTTAIISAGMYSLQIPTSTQIFDTDTFEFAVEDNAQANNRISTSLGSKFTSFGENGASIKIARDFENRTEYDLFKAGTARSITMVATQAASNIVNILMPVATINSYEVNLGGQADLVRASVEYSGVIDGTGKSYQMILTTTENIV